MNIGETYSSYLKYKDTYLNQENKESDYALQQKEYANHFSGLVLYWIHFMDDKYDSELIEKCTLKLSINEKQDLYSAYEYYNEHIDEVNAVYGDSKPQQ